MPHKTVHRHRTSSLSAMADPTLDSSYESSPANLPRPSSALGSNPEKKDDGSKNGRYTELWNQLEDLSVQEPALNSDRSVTLNSSKRSEAKDDEGSTTPIAGEGFAMPSDNERKPSLSGATPAFVPKPKIPTGPKDPNRPRNPFAVRAPKPTRYQNEGFYHQTERQPNGTYHTGMNDVRNPAQHGDTGSFQYGEQLEGYDGYEQTYVVPQDQGLMALGGYATAGPVHNTGYENAGYSNFNQSTGSPAPVTGSRGTPKPRNLRGLERWDAFIAYNRAQNIPQYVVDSPVNQHLIEQPASNLPPSHPSLPPKPPKSSLRRGNKTMKEIVVFNWGVYRNIVQVTLHNEPYGGQYETLEYIYDPSKYNFIEDFHSWSIEDKQKFLRKSSVEIRIDIPRDYEDPVQVNPGEIHNAILPYERNVIDTLNFLGETFTNNIKRCIVTLVFPANPLLTPLNTAISFAPPNGAPVLSPTFIFFDRLCHYIDDNFKSMSELTVLLRVPSNVRMPLTLPQLYHVLPFFDLSFYEWEIKYQPDNMTMNLGVSGWCLMQLDRERDRVVIERNERFAREVERLRGRRS